LHPGGSVPIFDLPKKDPMTDETQEHDENNVVSEPNREENTLHDFLEKRKLQIKVLQKLLDQIPIETDTDQDEEKTQTEEKP
jgi:hypothetical protein